MKFALLFVETVFDILSMLLFRYFLASLLIAVVGSMLFQLIGYFAFNDWSDKD